MATITGLWQTLFRLAPRLPGSDRELLTHFAATRDQPAFTELVRRHGGLVWSVCRRHLRESADAEDAFQATFLVLATRPESVRRAESLGAWLHGTAWRAASRLRRQRDRTRPLVETAASPDDPSLRDALVALDEELLRLPAKFRAPLTACYLLERTQDEAAGDLSLSVSTVKRRLATGRELLRQRLSRRGVELGAVLAALALRTPDAPAVLVQTTLTAAALGAASATVSPLVSGVLAMMWQAKLKAWAVGVALTAAVVGGTGYLATTGVGQGPPPPGLGGPARAVPLDDEQQLKADMEVLKQAYAVLLKNTQQNHRDLDDVERRIAVAQNRLSALAKPKSPELRKLREQHTEALTKLMNSYNEKMRGGLFTQSLAPLYIDHSEKLANAEMSLATANEQKIALWAKHRDRMRDFHLYFKSRSQGGIVTDEAVHEARAAELAAEIRLLELGGK